MHLLAGINHIAIMTCDLARFIEFYSSVFDAVVVFEESTPAFRHAILRTSETSWLHPAEIISGNPHAEALPTMFARGHLDHIALSAASKEAFTTLRARLLARAACDETVEDLGAFHSLWFTDPDGMRGELTVITNPNLTGIHAPKRIAVEGADSLRPESNRRA